MDPKKKTPEIGPGAKKEHLKTCDRSGFEAWGGGRRRGDTLLGGLSGRMNF